MPAGCDMWGADHRRLPYTGQTWVLSVVPLTAVAKYRAQLLEPEKKSAKGEGFDVMKSGGVSSPGHYSRQTRACA